MLVFFGFGGIGVGQKSICRKGDISVVPRGSAGLVRLYQ